MLITREMFDYISNYNSSLGFVLSHYLAKLKIFQFYRDYKAKSSNIIYNDMENLILKYIPFVIENYLFEY